MKFPIGGIVREPQGMNRCNSDTDGYSPDGRRYFRPGIIVSQGVPLYEIFIPLDQVIAAFAVFFPFIHTKLGVVLYNALPMNILKNGLIAFVMMFLYKPLSPILKGRI